MLKKFFRKPKTHNENQIHTEVESLLPIGSIVLLKDGEKKLMVIGIMQTDAEKPETEYDYLGILYPEGYLGSEEMYLFNHVDIEHIYFRGYEDKERSQFIEWLQKEYSNNRL